MKLLKYYNTIKYLKVSQIYYRIYYKLRDKIYKKNFNDYLKKDVNSDNLYLLNSIYSYESYYHNNSFKFLNLEYDFKNKIDWNFNKYGKLWTYNLNYFEFLNQKNISKTEGLRLIYDYIQNINSIRNGLEPFPISLRGLNWIKFLSFKDIKDVKIDKNLYAQYSVLYENIEYHLLGNHLLENAFSLMFAAYYFKDLKFYKKAKELLEKELNEQILKDGAHFELSPMYHQLMLFRVLDLINLLLNNQWQEDKIFLNLLTKKASYMLGYLKKVTFNSGEIALVNDSALNIAPTTKDLIDYARVLNIKAINSKYSCGYYMIKEKNYELFIDIANIKASYIPGHTHSDLFNFLLNINGKEFIVDSGVSTYETNAQREYERSTKAHNCVVINDESESEVWGSFRVGNRAKVIKKEIKPNYILAQHNGYLKKYKTIIQREFEYDENKILIKDKLIGKTKKAKAYLHIAKDIKLNKTGNVILTDFGIKIKFMKYNSIEIKDSFYSKEFNKKIDSKIIEINFKDNLIMEILL